MIAAIGAFDGYHIGHQSLLNAASAYASSTNCMWGVVTFARADGRVLEIKGARALFLPHEQDFLEHFFSIPIVHKIEFTPEIKNMSPRDFLDHISSKYGVDGIVVGSDFRFGKGREGSAELMKTEGRARGWHIDVCPLIEMRPGYPICSTAIRASLAQGDVEIAMEMLGYPFFCISRVIHGSKRGRTLGFPTANLDVPREKVEMREGVYAVVVRVDGEWRAGCMNVGRNPTFGDIESRRYEVFIDGYEGDLYGRDLCVFFLKHIRGEKKFSDVGALAAQIANDVDVIRDVCRRSLQSDALIWEKLAAVSESTCYNRQNDL